MTDVSTMITSYFSARHVAAASLHDTSEYPSEAAESSTASALLAIADFSLKALIGVLLFAILSALSVLLRTLAEWLAARDDVPSLLSATLTTVAYVLLVADTILFLLYMFRATLGVISKSRRPGTGTARAADHESQP
ncbi:MAG: hypothetical protein SXG53_22280 [Pseudomonadota bacterium]|nr:hypothetical protein [Pseudomonadota bacterium]